MRYGLLVSRPAVVDCACLSIFAGSYGHPCVHHGLGHLDTVYYVLLLRHPSVDSVSEVHTNELSIHIIIVIITSTSSLDPHNFIRMCIFAVSNVLVM
ncbi:hypothetical protein GALMADRAFT_742257 [Galerina marginata CBS 339.88]|uniref:Uncharacterized protein n=1 Tax=Galerina marginata (strain CBS 339.88) TaxID=685588 RepID=A0A067SSF6_GALM3|nr:hypothetical protein GALMADRAFT_742257 [Galerina marginata CBS 339.88]